MATTLAFEDEVLKLFFNATPIPNLAANATGTPATSLHVSLHTDDPARQTPSAQNSLEVAYTGYARIAVTRDATGWEVDQGKCFPAEIIEFAEVSGAPQTPQKALYFGVGEALTGAGKLMFSGKLNPPITLSNGAEPRIDNNSAASRFEESWA
jgi:hypothetical protein